MEMWIENGEIWIRYTYWTHNDEDPFGWEEEGLLTLNKEDFKRLYKLAKELGWVEEVV